MFTIKKIAAIFATVSLGLLSFAPLAGAQYFNQNYYNQNYNQPTLSMVIGNDANSRSQVDTRSNFTVIDTNHPANSSGQITSFRYYASNTNPFRFVVVDGSFRVQWVSPQITPSVVGANTYTPSTPIPVQSGYNVGIYVPSTGVIPFEATGAPASYTIANSGIPTVSSTLSFEGQSNRTYSFAAYTNNSQFPGNQMMNFPGFAFGRVSYSAGGLQRSATFFIESNRNVSPYVGTGTFMYRDANGDWYTVSVRRVAIVGSNVFFAGRVTSASQQSWVGQWLYAKATDNGSNGGQIWGSFMSSSSAIARFNSGNNLSDPPSGPFPISNGRMIVVGNLNFLQF